MAAAAIPAGTSTSSYAYVVGPAATASIAASSGATFAPRAYGRAYRYDSGAFDRVTAVSTRGGCPDCPEVASTLGGTTGPFTVDGASRPVDHQGNITALNGARYELNAITYDGLGRLRSISRADGVTLTYNYRVDGLLQEKTKTCPPGLPTCQPVHEYYLYDHRGYLLEIRDAAAPGTPVLARYYYGELDAEAPVAVDLANGGPPTRYYPLIDRQGSVFGLADAHGDVVEWVTYDPWGTPHVWAENGSLAPRHSSVGNRLLFQSHLWDSDVDLYFMRARVFDPYVGMFLQRDPMGYVDSVNLYAGFKNDPVNNRDPTGASVLQSIDDFHWQRWVNFFTCVGVPSKLLEYAVEEILVVSYLGGGPHYNPWLFRLETGKLRESLGDLPSGNFESNGLVALETYTHELAHAAFEHLRKEKADLRHAYYEALALFEERLELEGAGAGPFKPSVAERALKEAVAIYIAYRHMQRIEWYRYRQVAHDDYGLYMSEAVALAVSELDSAVPKEVFGYSYVDGPQDPVSAPIFPSLLRTLLDGYFELDSIETPRTPKELEALVRQPNLCVR